MTADINGDGLPDLAAGSNQPDSAFILLDSLTETVTVTAANVAPVGTGTHLVEAMLSRRHQLWREHIEHGGSFGGDAGDQRVAGDVADGDGEECL